jgi:anti-anti-sigma regulatory factor
MTVEFNENESVKTASVLRGRILEAFSEKEIVFDLSSLRRIDCAVGQLILASLREGKKRNVQIRFRGLSPALETQFELIGFKRRYS